jgi:endonuclease/exonuclease/phosphatase family metal-dependent hydrolase
MLALDRIYVRNAQVATIAQHDSPTARKASDHLPVVAEVRLEKRSGERDPRGSESRDAARG